MASERHTLTAEEVDSRLFDATNHYAAQSGAVSAGKILDPLTLSAVPWDSLDPAESFALDTYKTWYEDAKTFVDHLRTAPTIAAAEQAFGESGPGTARNHVHDMNLKEVFDYHCEKTELYRTTLLTGTFSGPGRNYISAMIAWHDSIAEALEYLRERDEMASGKALPESDPRYA